MDVILDKYKHLSREDRDKIENYLNEDESLKYIAEKLMKDPRTISKEIKKHLVKKDCSSSREFNHDNKSNNSCFRLKRFPMCCNGCLNRQHCRHDKYYYKAEVAFKEYRIVLVNSRNGIDLSKDELETMNATIKDGINKGQSFYSIVQTDNRIKKSSRTLYNYLEKNVLSVKNIDLRAKVKYKPRNHKYDYYKTFKDVEILHGRKIEDYFKFLSKNVVNCPVQLDTVEGSKKCKKVLLTIHFVAVHLMLIYLLDSQTKECVVDVFNKIEEQIGIESFKKLFPCILTDRGTEFVDAEGIEFNKDTGEKRTNVFYCDAYVSNQKGAIESNHRKIRYIFPKGSNSDVLKEEHAKIIQNNIANYPIKELSGSTPLTTFTSLFGKGIADKLGLEEIDSKNVNLTPTILIK